MYQEHQLLYDIEACFISVPIQIIHPLINFFPFQNIFISNINFGLPFASTLHLHTYIWFNDKKVLKIYTLA